jgi:hypothetical protein
MYALPVKYGDIPITIKRTDVKDTLPKVQIAVTAHIKNNA